LHLAHPPARSSPQAHYRPLQETPNGVPPVASPSSTLASGLASSRALALLGVNPCPPYSNPKGHTVSVASPACRFPPLHPRSLALLDVQWFATLPRVGRRRRLTCPLARLLFVLAPESDDVPLDASVTAFTAEWQGWSRATKLECIYVGACVWLPAPTAVGLQIGARTLTAAIDAREERFRQDHGRHSNAPKRQSLLLQNGETEIPKPILGAGNVH
jgi:hypothetical protein